MHFLKADTTSRMSPTRTPNTLTRWCIGILNFIFDKNSDDVHHEAKLMNVATKEVFYDKLSFITIELPKFNKTEDELVTEKL